MIGIRETNNPMILYEKHTTVLVENQMIILLDVDKIIEH